MQKFFSKTFNYIQNALLASLVLAGASNAATIGEIHVPLAYVNNTKEAAAATRLLTNYDIVLLVDSSKSMGYSCSNAHNAFTEVVGGNQSNDIASSVSEFLGAIGFSNDEVNSRWDWCRARANELSETGNSEKQGLRLIVFGESASVHDNVTGDAIEEIFANEKPHGGTFAARSLETEFANYFKRREAIGMHAKPLLIAIITDGSFGDKWSCRRALVKATQKMHHEDEILVAILKIGEDPKAPQFLNELDNELRSKYKAKYDIVEVAPFDRLNDRGMAGVLADVVNEKRNFKKISAQ